MARRISSGSERPAGNIKLEVCSNGWMVEAGYLYERQSTSGYFPPLVSETKRRMVFTTPTTLWAFLEAYVEDLKTPSAPSPGPAADGPSAPSLGAST